MKYLKFILFFSFLTSCFINKSQINVISWDQIKISQYNCQSNFYRWKEGGAPINGRYKIKYGKKMMAITLFNNGVEMEETFYHRKKKTNKTYYSPGYSNYTTIIYSEKNMSLLHFNAEYDSILYHYENNYLKAAEYYKKGEKFETKITYYRGSVSETSNTDDLLIDFGLFHSNYKKCPHKYLMKDPDTGEFYDEIYVDYFSPSIYLRNYYKLKNGEYEYDRSEM